MLVGVTIRAWRGGLKSSLPHGTPGIGSTPSLRAGSHRAGLCAAEPAAGPSE
jgi:hypothetical protein